jgi:hypothetical protein
MPQGKWLSRLKIVRALRCHADMVRLVPLSPCHTDLPFSQHR